MQYEETSLPSPGPGEVRIKHTAIGLNFVDVYYRSGLYPMALPSGLGAEAAGVVTELGKDVRSIEVGDRVAYGTGPLGAYAQERNFPANLLIKLPPAISDETAAAMMLKGMTARYLLKATHPVQPGDAILVHAAAGGMGQLLSQWGKLLGARVIGTVGSPEKAERAMAQGCDDVIVTSQKDIVTEVRALTVGKGVDVVYDGVGASTFDLSLKCLKPRGLMVSYGNASGPVTGVDLRILTTMGSLFVTRPSLGNYVADETEFRETAADVIDVVGSGKVKISINQRFALQDAAHAHRELETRRTTGASVLLP